MTPPARLLRLAGEASRRDEAEPMLAAPGDAVLVRRGPLRSIVIACPDGCGQTLVINLDRRAGKAWRIDMRGEGATLIPSVWRDGGCESHFVVWRGRIIWCGRFADGNVEPDYDPKLEPLVLDAMDEVEPRGAGHLADVIDELVWDVDRVARRLVDRGLATMVGEEGQEGFVRSGSGRTIEPEARIGWRPRSRAAIARSGATTRDASAPTDGCPRTHSGSIPQIGAGHDSLAKTPARGEKGWAGYNSPQNAGTRRRTPR